MNIIYAQEKKKTIRNKFTINESKIRINEFFRRRKK